MSGWPNPLLTVRVIIICFLLIVSCPVNKMDQLLRLSRNLPHNEASTWKRMANDGGKIDIDRLYSAYRVRLKDHPKRDVAYVNESPAIPEEADAAKNAENDVENTKEDDETNLATDTENTKEDGETNLATDTENTKEDGDKQLPTDTEKEEEETNHAKDKENTRGIKVIEYLSIAKKYDDSDEEHDAKIDNANSEQSSNDLEIGEEQKEASNEEGKNPPIILVKFDEPTDDSPKAQITELSSNNYKDTQKALQDRIRKLNRKYMEFSNIGKKATPDDKSSDLQLMNKPLRLSALHELLNVVENLKQTNAIEEIVKELNKENVKSFDKLSQYAKLAVTAGNSQRSRRDYGTRKLKELIPNIKDAPTQVGNGNLYDVYKKRLEDILKAHKFPQSISKKQTAANRPSRFDEQTQCHCEKTKPVILAVGSNGARVSSNDHSPCHCEAGGRTENLAVDNDAVKTSNSLSQCHCDMAKSANIAADVANGNAMSAKTNENKQYSNSEIPKTIEIKQYSNMENPKINENKQYSNSESLKIIENKQYSNAEIPKTSENKQLSNMENPKTNDNKEYSNVDIPKTKENKEYLNIEIPKINENREYSTMELTKAFENKEYLKALHKCVQMNKESSYNGGLKPYFLSNSKQRQMVWNEVPLIRPGTLRIINNNYAIPSKTQNLSNRQNTAIRLGGGIYATNRKIGNADNVKVKSEQQQHAQPAANHKIASNGKSQKQLEHLLKVFQTRHRTAALRKPAKRGLPFAGSVNQPSNVAFPEVLVNPIRGTSSPSGGKMIENMARQMHVSPVEMAQRITSSNDVSNSQLLGIYPSQNSLASQSFGNQVPNISPPNSKLISEGSFGPMDSSNIGPVLEKILERLQTIQELNVGPDSGFNPALPCCFADPTDGGPCDLTGSWESSLLGIRINIRDDRKVVEEVVQPICAQPKTRRSSGPDRTFKRQCVKITSAQIREENPFGTGMRVLNITVQEQLPPRPHEFLDNITEWFFAAYAVSTVGGPITLQCHRIHSKLIGTFVGYCRTCGCIDTVFGSWTFCQPSHDCQDVTMSVFERRDIWRRFTLDDARKERYKNQLYKKSKFAQAEKARQYSEQLKNSKCQGLNNQNRNDPRD